MFAQSPHPSLSILGPSADDLINVAGVDSLTKAERWHLIDRIDTRIDVFQGWQKSAKPGSAEHSVIVAKLQALRLKRFQIWNTFYPRFVGVITPAVSYQPACRTTANR